MRLIKFKNLYLISLFGILIFSCTTNYYIHVNMNGSAHVKCVIDYSSLYSEIDSAGTRKDSAWIEEGEQELREQYVSNLINNFEFYSNYQDSITIEFDIQEVDSLSHYLPIFVENGIEIHYTAKKFIITKPDDLPELNKENQSPLNMGDTHIEFTFDRPIKKIKTKKKSNYQSAEKLIIEGKIDDLNFKGKKNQIIILFK